MARSSKRELVRRVNAAVTLLQRGRKSKIIEELSRRYRVSKPQAFRYIQRARAAKSILPVPERKVVFTVKLPLSLAQRLRLTAKSSGESLSDMVTRALEAFLRRGLCG